MNMSRKKISELLKNYRREMQMTKSEAAKKLGVSLPFIYQIENGSKLPTPDRLEGFITIYHIRDVGTDSLAEELRRILFKERTHSEEEKFNKYTPSFQESLREAESASVKREDVVEHFITPILTFEQANKLNFLKPSLPHTNESTTSTLKGDGMFGLKIRDDQMFPKFNEGEVAFICLGAKYQNGDFVLVQDKKSDSAFLRQYKKYGDKEVLHALNEKHGEIELDKTNRYVIAGRVVKKEQTY